MRNIFRLSLEQKGFVQGSCDQVLLQPPPACNAWHKPNLHWEDLSDAGWCSGSKTCHSKLRPQFQTTDVRLTFLSIFKFARTDQNFICAKPEGNIIGVRRPLPRLWTAKTLPFCKRTRPTTVFTHNHTWYRLLLEEKRNPIFLKWRHFDTKWGMGSLSKRAVVFAQSASISFALVMRQCNPNPIALQVRKHET